MDAEGDTGAGTSVAVDANGAVHIAYRDETRRGLRYATNAGGAWTLETVDEDGDTGFDPSIAIDGAGAAHISYLRCNLANGSLCTNGDLLVANDVAGAWDVEVVDSDDNTGYGSAAAFDGAGALHVVYMTCVSTNGGLCYNGDLRHATFAGGQWQLETAESAGDTGYSASLAVDAQGALHVSHVTCVGTNGGLCYDGDLVVSTNAGGRWQTVTVDSEADADTTSIALDSSGAQHVAYLVCNGSNGGYGCYGADLRHASDASGAWVVEEVDTDGDTGYFPALVIEPSDRLDVAYYDWDVARLRFATTDGAGWQLETIDEATSTGAYGSMALAAAGLYASYYDVDDGDLRLAARSLPDGVDNDCDGAVY